MHCASRFSVFLSLADKLEFIWKLNFVYLFNKIHLKASYYEMISSLLPLWTSLYLFLTPSCKVTKE